MLMNNRIIQWIICVAIGIAVGVVFNPSKKEYETKIQEMTQTYEKQIQIIQDETAVKVEQLIQQASNTESSYKQTIAELDKKIVSISQENTQLKQTSKVVTYKIVKPDGTIIETSSTTTTNEVISQISKQMDEQLNKKIAETETKYKQQYESQLKTSTEQYQASLKTIQTEYDLKIQKLIDQKIVVTNEKKLGVALGIQSDSKAFLNASYDIWGPVFVDSHIGIDMNKNWVVGAGIGVRF
jgi:BMFP domain-containing protein YqiC